MPCHSQMSHTARVHRYDEEPSSVGCSGSTAICDKVDRIVFASLDGKSGCDVARWRRSGVQSKSEAFVGE